MHFVHERSEGHILQTFQTILRRSLIVDWPPDGVIRGDSLLFAFRTFMRDTAPPAFKDKSILVHLPTYVVRMDSPLEEKYDAALRKGKSRLMPPSVSLNAAVRRHKLNTY